MQNIVIVYKCSYVGQLRLIKKIIIKKYILQ